LIIPTHWKCYEGELKDEAIRHGFGTQYFVNGEKFIGSWEEGEASGHGTFYALNGRIVGIW
jgi:hypothetical protein